ncbi:NAD(P)H-hydrate dehydratase [Eupransor demetentiae]|uniref:ADP-dependent (S)-NAD(P)H-hydrate dehydratase n=1 Tax=Eupransor demetentiae TaxID=3109584 RepID=A0ABM9N4Y3_9LACO|nr:NAD(P)H-hydrate dehydratase domain (Nnr2) [Lactobacillaceae bacterium LMG 33000]
MEILTDEILKKVIQKRASASHKGTYGRVLIVGGSANFGGAAIMNALGAVQAGAGLVSVATDPSNFAALHAQLPEAMVTDYQQDFSDLMAKQEVILIGSGLGNQLDILKRVLERVQKNQILILDGSALTMLSQNPIKLPDCQLIMTPHQMEWQRIGEVPIADQSREDANWEALVNFQPEPILVLKSNHTQVYAENCVHQLSVGGPYQATGGMGDTLAGIIAGFVAQFKPLKDAVLAATYIHSAIAEELSKKAFVTLPTTISAQLPYYMKKYEALQPEDMPIKG